MIDIVHSSRSASGGRNHLLPSVNKKYYHWRHTRFRWKHVVSLCVLPPVRAFRRFSEPSQRPKNRSEELNSAVGRAGGVGVGLGSQCNGSRFVNYDQRCSICLSCTPFFRLSLLTFVNRYFPVISLTVSWAFSCTLKLGFSCLFTIPANRSVCSLLITKPSSLVRTFLANTFLSQVDPYNNVTTLNYEEFLITLSLIYIFKMDDVLFVCLFIYMFGLNFFKITGHFAAVFCKIMPRWFKSQCYHFQLLLGACLHYSV